MKNKWVLCSSGFPGQLHSPLSSALHEDLHFPKLYAGCAVSHVSMDGPQEKGHQNELVRKKSWLRTFTHAAQTSRVPQNVVSTEQARFSLVGGTTKQENISLGPWGSPGHTLGLRRDNAFTFPSGVKIFASHILSLPLDHPVSAHIWIPHNRP